MKFPKILIALTLVLVASCEKNNNEEAIQLLAGHWHVWDFEPSFNSPAAESLLAKEAILQLEKLGCDLMEFTFKTDQKVSYKEGVRYLTVSTEKDGVQVNCAPKYDFKEGTFDFDNKTLTLNFQDETVFRDANLEGEYLTTQVDDMLINNIIVSGKVIFKRETN